MHIDTEGLGHAWINAWSAADYLERAINEGGTHLVTVRRALAELETAVFNLRASFKDDQPEPVATDDNGGFGAPSVYH